MGLAVALHLHLPRQSYSVIELSCLGALSGQRATLELVDDAQAHNAGFRADSGHHSHVVEAYASRRPDRAQLYQSFPRSLTGDLTVLIPSGSWGVHLELSDVQLERCCPQRHVVRCLVDASRRRDVEAVIIERVDRDAATHNLLQRLRDVVDGQLDALALEQMTQFLKTITPDLSVISLVESTLDTLRDSLPASPFAQIVEALRERAS